MRFSYSTGHTQLAPFLPQYTVPYQTKVNCTLMGCLQDVIVTSDTTTCSHLGHNRGWWDVLCVGNYELPAYHALIVFPYSLTDSIFLLPFVVLFFIAIYLTKYNILLDVTKIWFENIDIHTLVPRSRAANWVGSWWHVPLTTRHNELPIVRLTSNVGGEGVLFVLLSSKVSLCRGGAYCGLFLVGIEARPCSAQLDQSFVSYYIVIVLYSSTIGT